MAHVNKFLPLAVATLAGVVVLALGWSTARSADQATLAGDAGPDPYAQGCVDCHTDEGAQNIGTLLAAFKHKNVDGQTTAVPGDCADCHSDDGGNTPLSELSHVLHYEKPAENEFIASYGGNCLHCHALDAGTGVISVKSGPKNW